MKKKRGEEVEEGKNKNVQGSKRETVEAIKVFYKKILFIAVIVVSAFFLCGAGFYYIKRDDFKATSETKQAYSTTVNNQGKIEYTKKEVAGKVENNTNEGEGTIVKLTPAEMAEEYKDVLKQYISEDDEEYSKVMQYLMGAETVTSMPYIDGRAEGELNGGVKFYRYTDEEEVNGANEESLTEPHRLKYKALDEFNIKMQEYERDAENNRDIFNYFTIDSDGAVLVAYGSEEYREIHTGPNAAGATDKDLDIGIINENSTFESSYSGHYGTGFYASKFTISTKKIDYKSLVEQYKMPSTLLYSFLIQTENLDFVKALADIAYQSQIAIGIYDNKTDSETREMYTYKKLMDMSVDVDIKYESKILDIPASQNTGPAFSFKKIEDLYEDEYQYIIESCESETKNETGTIEHQVTYMNSIDHGSLEQGWIEHPDKKMYVARTDANNKIISLGEGETYKTMYKKTKNTMSTPTVGVLLADTWIAKWVATYNKENMETPTYNVPETPKEDELIEDYGTGVVTGAFADVEGIYGYTACKNNK